MVERSKYIHIRVTPEEVDRIKERMEEAGIRSMTAYIEYYCEPNILGKAKRLVGMLKNMEEQFSKEHKIYHRSI